MSETSTPKPVRMWEIPIGTPAVKCMIGARTCTEYIYFVTTAKGAQMPVSINCDGGRAPDPPLDPRQLDLLGDAPPRDPKPGSGVSHFGNCPDYTKAFSRKP